MDAYEAADTDKAQAIKERFSSYFKNPSEPPKRRRSAPMVRREKEDKFKGDVRQYKTQISQELQETDALEAYTRAGKMGNRALMIALEESFPNTVKSPSPWESAGRALRSGLTFGFDDEIIGALGGDKEAARDQQSIDATRNVLASRAGGFAGALGPGGAAGLLGRGIKASTGLGQGLKLASLGAGEGAVIGAGAAPDIESIPEYALPGAAIGAGLGLAVPAAGLVGNAAKLRFSPSVRAQNAISESLGEEGITAAKESLGKLPPGSMLADTGEAIRDIGASQIMRNTPAGVEAKKALSQRRDLSGSEVVESIDYNFGTGNINQKVKDMNSQAKESAKPLYDEAFKTKIKPTKDMEYILENDKIAAKAWSEAIDRVARRNFKTEAKGDIRSKAMTDVRVWDQWKRVIDGKIGKAVRSGDNSQVSELSSIKNEVISSIDDMVPKYKEARGVYAGSKSNESAIDLGKKVFQGDIDVTASKIEPGTEEFFKLGVAKAARDKVNNVKDKGDKAGVLVGSEGLRDRLRVAFGKDESRADEFIAKLQGMRAQQDTANAALEGSKTAKLMLADQPIAARAVQDRSTLVADMFNDVFIGDTKDTADQIVKALFESDLVKNEKFISDLLKAIKKEKGRVGVSTAVTGGISQAIQQGKTEDE